MQAERGGIFATALCVSRKRQTATMIAKEEALSDIVAIEMRKLWWYATFRCKRVSYQIENRVWSIKKWCKRRGELDDTLRFATRLRFLAVALPTLPRIF